jgi:hypothetical protein
MDRRFPRFFPPADVPSDVASLMNMKFERPLGPDEVNE